MLQIRSKYVRLLYLNRELKVVRVFSWYNIVIQKENIQRCLLSILTQWNSKVLFDVQYYLVPRNKSNVLRIKWRWLLTLRELIDCVWLRALYRPNIGHDEIAVIVIYYDFSLLTSSTTLSFFMASCYAIEVLCILYIRKCHEVVTSLAPSAVYTMYFN